jgi:prepilin-type N-terminal cleavage/methylation domain-containing protein
MHLSLKNKVGRLGFSLIELLIVIAVIGIMSALILTSINNAAQDSRLVIARQQQVVLQEALNAWINSPINNSLADAKSSYANAVTSKAKLQLVREYLQNDTFEQFDANSTTDQIRSEAMVKAGIHLTFSGWTATNTPTVNMIKSP